MKPSSRSKTESRPLRSVVSILEDGYTIHDRLLRAARVAVAKPRPQPAPGAERRRLRRPAGRRELVGKRGAEGVASRPTPVDHVARRRKWRELLRICSVERLSRSASGMSSVSSAIRSNPLADAIRRSRIDWVGVRHEEGAALAAAGQAKLTGRLAVCAGTTRSWQHASGRRPL